jgi:hypothetical protein
MTPWEAGLPIPGSDGPHRLDPELGAGHTMGRPSPRPQAVNVEGPGSRDKCGTARCFPVKRRPTLGRWGVHRIGGTSPPTVEAEAVPARAS